MPKTIRVKALAIKGRAYYVLRWRDPVTNKWRDETTQIPASERNRKQANAAAARKEEQLAGVIPEDITWQEFDERYCDEWLSGKTKGTRIAWETATACLVAFNRATRAGIVQPGDITADVLHRWAAWMRRREYAEPTIKSYLGIVRAGLNWAADVGLLVRVPRFPKITGGEKMGGRPITGEEFDRLVEAVPKVRKKRVAEWQRLLRGLWLSGLRISEAIDLSWDWGSPFAVELDSSCFAIRRQKSQKAEYAPMTPDFVAFLRQTPESQRRGRVFSVACAASQASRVIAEFGAQAKIVVTEDGGTATAHDLRRAFGTRWASHLQPADLQQLMRHADIATTMRYYVRVDSLDLAQRLAAKGEILGETPPSRKAAKRRQKSS